MKIHSIRFTNLNSLYGSWALDLTHPAYTAETIFVISGPTGAGKTTLLDALCLALYGKTPRLDTISKSVNEVMSRQTGQCSAEVTFETGSGLFRAHWSQHRARKQASGELQQPRHELADARTGRIIETGIRDVARAIEETTGMDYRQFTRSMLLAQGHFAEFLQASADERAPLLEQITGTELYSAISLHVHKRTGAEQENLKLLEVGLESVALLDAEERRTLVQRITSLRQEVADRQMQLQLNMTEKNRLEAIAAREAELAAISKEEARLEELLRREAPVEAQLERCRQARLLNPGFIAVRDLRETQADEARQLGAARQEAERLALALTAARQAISSAEADHRAVSASKKESMPLLHHVRSLDIDIRHHKQRQQAIAGQQQKLASDIETIERRAAAVDAVITEKKTAQRRLDEYFSASAADENLAADLGSIKTLIRARTGLLNRRQALEERLLSLKNGVTSARRQLAVHEDRILALKNEGDSARQALEQTKEQIAMLLGTSQLSDLLGIRLRLEELKKNLATRAEYGRRLDSLKAEGEKLQQRREAVEIDMAQLEAHYRDLSTQLAEALAHRERTAGIRLGSERIENLADLRETLVPEEPCPLCGSTDHPYRRAAPSVDSDREHRRLKEATAACDTLSRQQAETATRLAIAKRDLEHLAGSITDMQNAIREQQHDLQEVEEDGAAAAAALQIRDDSGVTAASVETRVELIASKITGIENLQRQQERLTVRLESSRTAETEIREQIRELGGRCDRDQALSDKAAEDLHRLADEQQQLHAELETLLAPYALDPGTAIDAGLIARLEERAAIWNGRNREARSLSDDIVAQQALHRNLLANELQLRADLAGVGEQAAAARNQVQELEEQRHHLFSTKDPEAEERLLEEALDRSARLLDEARGRCHDREKEYSVLKERIRALEGATARRSTQLDEAEQAFRRDLERQGFDSETDFGAALLPDDQFAEMARKIEELHRQQQENATLRRDLEHRLAEARAGQTTSPSIEAIAAAIGILTEEISSRQERIGRDATLLETDDRKKALHREQTAAVEAQRREVDTWLQLHRLIGSSDGKKFRNFAQGITFETLIAKANSCLRTMSDRYLLVHSGHKPLELDIIDAYQAGEIRSTKNLSGGESFIVSLALALGLSAMTSTNIQVDSLFLDEGFGTLDEEALETAIATLTGLREQGKLIGIISHVSSLKERIPTRIEVTPGPGGRSTIAGPGISRL